MVRPDVPPDASVQPLMEALLQMANLFSTRSTAPIAAAVDGRTAPISS